MLDVAAKFFHGVVKSIVPSDNLLRNSIRYSNYWTNNFEKQFDLDTYYWKFVFCVLWYYLPTLPAPPEWRAKVGLLAAVHAPHRKFATPTGLHVLVFYVCELLRKSTGQLLDQLAHVSNSFCKFLRTKRGP